MTLGRIGWEGQSSGSCFHEMFEARADETPDAVAVVSGEGQLTYRELEARANQVAHALRALGVGPERLVGLCTGTCPEMLVGLLGILKAGGAYVPLDPAYPRQRLAFMLEDARVSVLLTRSGVEAELPESSARVLRLDANPEFARRSTSRPGRLATPENLAYALYTSGSTGRPKGVFIEHRGVLDFAREVEQRFDLGPGSRILQFASLSFDASVWELLAAWVRGGALHLMSPEARLPGPALLHLLRERAITHWMVPPSVLTLLGEAELPALRVLVSVGEACPASIAARWSIGRRFFNGYGPTEATVITTLFEGSGGGRPPPIGRAVAGAELHLLDERLQPVPAGHAGELFIGGGGLARGYLHRPELTAERFIPHPVTGARLYRTGDLVRLLPDGNLEFLGRVDHQLKIRGNRVEPGEVEEVLARHPAVRSVVVVGRVEESGERRLVAYLVVRPGCSPGPSGWHHFAREALPEFMVPTAFVELSALPLSPNGKVDRHALPAPGRSRPALASAFRPPLTPLQRTLADLWSQVLDVAPVGLDDDFLELGGNSLRAASLATRVWDVLGVDLSPHEVLAAPTLACLSERIEALREGPEGPPPLVAAARPEKLPLSFAQQRLWFLHRLDPGSAAYNLPFLLRLTGPLDVPSLARALEALVGRHEALRTTFPLVGDEPVQHITPAGPRPLPLLDLRPVPESQREGQLTELARRELSRPFDLERGPLLRTHLVALGETEHALLLAIHHAVCDGASLEGLMRELAAFYESFLDGSPSPLSEPPIQYAEYTLWQRQWLQGRVLEKGLTFWKQELDGAPRVLDLPTDRPRPEAPSFRGAVRAFQVPASTVRALDALARAEGATPFMALLAGLGALLHRCTGSQDVLVGTPVAGRNRSELEGLIGFFVNTLVLRVRLHGDPTFRELLARVRERSLAAYAHQDSPFEKLVEFLRPEREGGHQPLFQVMFALQRPPPDVVTRGGLRLTLSEADIQVAPFDLTWNLWEYEGRMEGTLLYNTDLFDPSTIEGLIGDFQALLEEVATVPERRLSQLERPGRWGLPEGANPAEVEAALLAEPGVEDCAVRIRRAPASQPQRVAYVVSSRARVPGNARALPLPPRLTPELLVPIQAMPLTSRGQVDEAALQRLPILDEQLARHWEAVLRQGLGSGEAAVGVLPVSEPPSLLHLADVLPGFQAETPVIEQPASEGVATPPPDWDSGSGPMAFSDGGPQVLPEGAPRTLVEALVRTASTEGERGITYVGSDGVTQHQSYAELLHEARCVLAGLRAQGLGPGARVILQSDSPRDHCTAFWACVLGGLTPVTVAVAPTYETHNAVVGKLHGVWELLGHPPVLTRARLAPALRGLRTLLPMEELTLLCIEELRPHPPAEHLYPARPEEVAFLQLSSGSTGVPKCIQETHAALIHHFHAEARVNDFTPDEVFLNWLPFDHVVPILTYHLCVTYLGHAQVHASTDWVLADPLRWLDLMESQGVTFSWSPNFGFKLLSDALRRSPRRAWRLGRLKRLMNAGEQVTAPVAGEFLRLVAPFGIQPHVMQPAFGMAELCTLVTYQNQFHPEHGVHRMAKSSLGGRLERRDVEDASTVTFVDLGPPNPGVQLRIVDVDNRLQPEGVIGRLQVRGKVVTPGYLHNEAANREAFVGDGWFNTGDSGFLLDGRLTLTGREKELIIVRGSHLYCHEIEDQVRDIEGVEPTYVAACGVEAAAQGTEGFALFFTPGQMELEVCARISAAIRARVTERLGVSPTFVIPVPRDEFPRTTSGKIQRGVLKKALTSGRFASILKELDLHQGNANTIPDWFFRKVWRPREALTRSPVHAGACLIFLDGLGLGARLAETLRRSGRRCFTVEPGAEFIRTGPDAFRLPPCEPEAYRRLLVMLAEEERRLAQVLHLWTYDGDCSEAAAEEARQRGVLGLLLLSQALARNPGGQEPLRLQVVSSQAQPTSPGEEVDCGKALLLGLLLTLPQEWSWLDARHLDLPLAPPEQNASLVLGELEVLQREQEVAWRHGQRLVPRLERVALSARDRSPPPFETGGVYLVSGGLGALGVELSRRLLQHHQARLLLLGRSSLDEPHVQGRRQSWQELVELAAHSGGEVLYEAVDVCEAEALRDAVSRAEARWGRPLGGIFHLAGMLEERVLAEETLEHFTAVLRPKVEGTRALEQLLTGRPKAFFAGFSSVNGSFGGFSVAAYSAANRFLEHFTHARRGLGGSRHFCFAWSQWEGFGRAHPEAEQRLVTARGYQTISWRRGWLSLRVGLCQEPGTLLIGLDARSPPLRMRLENTAIRTQQLCAFFTGTGQPEPDPAAEASLPRGRDRFGTPVPPPLRRRAERIVRTSTGAVDLEALGLLEEGRQRAAPARVALQGEAERKVASIWQEALGVEAIGALDNFFELGGHSLLLAQVHGRLERAFGRELSVLELFRHPTVRTLSAYLSGQETGRPGSANVEERARRQRAAQGRHRSRRALNSGMEGEE